MWIPPICRSPVPGEGPAPEDRILERVLSRYQGILNNPVEPDMLMFKPYAMNIVDFFIPQGRVVGEFEALITPYYGITEPELFPTVRILKPWER